jgi:hypothetical protein
VLLFMVMWVCLGVFFEGRHDGICGGGGGGWNG